ncbi:MAG: PilZ domain-containing protein [Desulfobacterales bacterium]|nr:PilZ domain-containing protein [Desulfobacterales bacterium]
METDSPQERRQSKRFPVEGAFVCLTSTGRRLWHILDIARGGLSFRYVPALESMEGSSELEIVTRDASFSLEKVPFQTISDTELKDRVGNDFKLNRCGVKFGSLTQPQAARLDDFISRYSAGAA